MNFGYSAVSLPLKTIALAAGNDGGKADSPKSSAKLGQISHQKITILIKNAKIRQNRPF